MYKFYCDAFQIHRANHYEGLALRHFKECTEEEAAATALGAADASEMDGAGRVGRLRTKAEVEQEVQRLLGQAPAQERAS